MRASDPASVHGSLPISNLRIAGNALLSQGRLKRQMLDVLNSSAAPLDQAQAAAVAAAAERVAGEAEELLLLAGGWVACWWSGRGGYSSSCAYASV